MCRKPSSGFSGHVFFFLPFCACDFFSFFFLPSASTPLFVGLRHLSLRNDRLQNCSSPWSQEGQVQPPGRRKTNSHLPKKSRLPVPSPLAAPLPRCLFLADFNSLLPGAAEELGWLDPEAAANASFLGLLTSGEQVRHRHAE